MEGKLRWRITAFFVGGILNGLLGLYVVVSGLSFLPADTARTLAIVFLVFAAVDFYFAHKLKKKLLADYGGGNATGSGPQRRT